MIENSYPLSPMQQGMLFHSLYDPTAGAYIEQLVCALHENLNIPAFERAWQRVIARHPVLRTAFRWADQAQPVQEVLASVQCPLEQQDWRGLSPLEQAARLETLLTADRRRGFILNEAPLMRLLLLRCADADYRLVWTFHHALLDGRSLRLVLAEVFTFYAASCQGQDLTLALPRPYSDYIDWLQQQDPTLAQTFWRQHLAGFTAPTSLTPVGFARSVPNGSNRRGLIDLCGLTPNDWGRQELHLSPTLTSALRDLAQQYQFTLNTLVQGTWALLLSRYSGETDVVFGATRAGRRSALNGESTESMVGLFINTLPVRIDVPFDMSIATWLRESRIRTLAVRPYEHTPLTQIQAWSDLPATTPLFNTLLVFEDYLLNSALRAQGGDWLNREFKLVEHTHYPLTLGAYAGDSLLLTLEYARRDFSDDAIGRMLGHLRVILQNFAANPTQPLAAVSLLTEAEHRQILVEWNDTAAAYPHDQCAHHLFETQVTRTPNAIALIAGETQLTYQELNRRANQLARHLQTLGVGPETLVGLCLERSPEMIIGLLGILKAGAAYVPLDPAYPPARLALMAADSAAPVIVTQARLASLFDTSARLVCLDADWPLIAAQPADNPTSPVKPDNLAYVIYTSGSTGQPKGVMIPHHALVNYTAAAADAYNLSSTDRVLQFASLSFDASAEEIYPCLARGATLVLRDEEMLASPAAFLRQCGDWAITILDLPTAYWHELAASLESEKLPFSPALRLIIVGGERLRPESLAAWQRHAPPRIRLVNTYGPTEATIVATAADLSAEIYQRNDPFHPVTNNQERDSSFTTFAQNDMPEVPIGHPVRNVQVYLLDRCLQPVPIGVPGELHIGGLGLARGYLNRPDLTAERFIPNPFISPLSSAPSASPLLYKTGDLALYRPDGQLEFLGRLDDQVKLRGFRIELGEIESALRQHPAVREVVVTVWDDPSPTLRADQRLAAYIVAAEPPPTAAELRAFLRERLPGYMLPASFTPLAALPLTPSGKLNRRALPAPAGAPPGLAGTYTAPRTPLEETLAALYAEVLKLERVGIHDNFFELGGHSLLATQLIARIGQTCRVNLPLRTLFENPTIAGLAPQVQSGIQKHSFWTPVQHLPLTTPAPLSFAQQRLWFLDQVEPGNPVYNVPLAYRLIGPLDVTALTQSLTALTHRHENLRTTFAANAGQPVQVIAPPSTITLAATDLSSLPLPERETEAHGLAVAEARRPFDLAAGPLWRTTLLRLTETEHLFLLTMHHSITDGRSIELFINELSIFYKGFVTHQPASLPDLPWQYADFARWQRDWLPGEVLTQQLSYWQRHLAGAPPLLFLPTDRPRPPAQTFRGHTSRFHLDPALTQQLRALGQQNGATLYMTMLAAFGALLARYTGQEDIVMGAPITNRRAEVEPLLGLFVNTLALRLDLSGDPTFRELLGRVRETALAAYDHQDMPFEQLLDALRPERDLSHTPLFQVMLAWQTVEADPTWPGLTWQTLELDTGTAKFDLSLLLEERGQQVTSAWEYSTDLFEADTMARLAGHFETLLAGIIANPDQHLSVLPLLTDAERRRLLVEWNDTAADYPRDQCVQHLFEAQATRTPEAIAAVCEGQTLTYTELNRRANQLAHYLRARGVGPETLVGLGVERSLDMLVGLLGILKAGAAYVPLDPTYPAARLAFMVSDTAAPLVLTQARPAALFTPLAPQLLCLDTDWPLIAALPADNPASEAAPDNLAYVIYTSGSTGQPKGVMITHRGLVNYLTWCSRAYDVAGGSGAPVHSSLGFDLTVTSLFPPLLAGRPVMLLSEKQANTVLPGVFKLSAALLNGRDFSLVKITPAHLEALAHLLAPAEVAGRTRRFIIGGEALPGEDLIFWQTHAPDTILVNEYGPTETVVGCCVYEVPVGETICGDVPIGRPIANTQLYILDKHLQPAPIGVPGELYIGGDGVARGYLNRPDLTAERFIPNPFIKDEGRRMKEETSSLIPHPSSLLYKTGDLARYRPDGVIEFLGRIDQQIKIRGFRIEPGEIEAVLSQHPAVREAVVLAREDTPGQKRLAAYVTLHPGQAWVNGDLRGFLQAKLPDYMIPAVIIPLPQIPLTPNGKVDYRALPAPEMTRADAVFVAPRTSAEITLARLWADALRLEQVSIHDNFFELGGDSILSIQIVARANQAGLRLTPRQIFQHQTIAALAAAAETGPVMQANQSPVAGSAPLTPIQHWFFTQNLPAPHHWNMPVQLEIQPPVDPVLLKKALHHLIEHHDALRLRFTPTEGRWQQVNKPLSSSSEEESQSAFFVYVNLSILTAEEQNQKIEASAAEVQTDLNLATGPLLRVALFDFGPDQPSLLLLAAHHLVVDGVSWRILLDDLQTAYRQLSQRQGVNLPPKTTSFKKWAESLAAYAQSATLRREVAYWLNQTRPELPPLPVDSPADHSANTEGAAQTVTVALTHAETRALLQEVPAACRAHINEVLLTALALALRQWSGAAAMFIDLEGHGREAELVGPEVDLSRTVGWFTTIFPVRLEVTDTTPLAALAAIKEQVRRRPGHGLGYGLLRYLSSDSAITQALAARPQAEVSFNYLGQVDLNTSGVLTTPAIFGLPTNGLFAAPGPARAPAGQRPYLLEVNGLVSGGCLRVEWTYCPAMHQSATIERVAQAFMQSLRQFITASQSAPVDYSPADFLLAQFEHPTLARLLAAYPQLADVYPLSPGQQEIWGPALRGGLYFLQWYCTLHGDLDISAFKQAWKQVIERHTALRTVLAWEKLAQPLQVVLRQVEIPWDERDWRQLPAPAQTEQFAAFLQADQERSFDLSQPPLLRLALLRLADQTYKFVWSHHHLLLDGWSTALIWREVVAVYRALRAGQIPSLPPARPYQDYIAWLRRQDLAPAETFWRKTLTGVDFPHFETFNTVADLAEQTTRLSPELTTRLQTLAQQHRLTLNTICQGAWALVLSRQNGQTTVVFGSTVSGRPAELPGVEGIAGLFINTLPVRVEIVPSQSLLPWLAQLQAQQVELRQYDYTPPALIRQWLTLPPDTPLFESFVRFQNYPAAWSDTGGELEVRDLGGVDWWPYPLGLVVEPGSALTLTLTYNRRHFDDDTVARLLASLQSLLAAMADKPERALGEI